MIPARARMGSLSASLRHTSAYGSGPRSVTGRQVGDVRPCPVAGDVGGESTTSPSMLGDHRFRTRGGQSVIVLDFYWHVHDLALDCVNQGGISNLRMIHPPERTDRQ